MYRPYNDNCENKLPCGICRLTGQVCPKHGYTPDWTYRPEYGPIYGSPITDKAIPREDLNVGICEDDFPTIDEGNYHTPVCPHNKNKKRR